MLFEGLLSCLSLEMLQYRIQQYIWLSVRDKNPIPTACIMRIKPVAWHRQQIAWLFHTGAFACVPVNSCCNGHCRAQRAYQRFSLPQHPLQSAGWTERIAQHADMGCVLIRLCWPGGGCWQGWQGCGQQRGPLQGTCSLMTCFPGSEVVYIAADMMWRCALKSAPAGSSCSAAWRQAVFMWVGD